MDKRCLDCPVQDKCNLGADYGSMYCTMKRAESKKTKKYYVESVYKKRVEKALEHLEVSCNHEYFYKYDGKYLKSEIKDQLIAILRGNNE